MIMVALCQGCVLLPSEILCAANKTVSGCSLRGWRLRAAFLLCPATASSHYICVRLVVAVLRKTFSGLYPSSLLSDLMADDTNILMSPLPVSESLRVGD